MESPSVETLFVRALQLPAGPARDSFLARECRGDEAVLGSVVSLIAAHDAAGGFLDPAVERGQAGHGLGTGAEDPSPDPEETAACAMDCLAALSAGQPMAAAARLGRSHRADRTEACERIEAALRVRAMAGASRAEDSGEDEPVVRLPGFRIERRFGSGALGIVYAAQDEKLGRRVAIKVLRQRAGDAVARRRVLEEARNAAGLDDPAVVTIFSVLDEAEPPAIVMEYVEGFPIDRFAEHLHFGQKARLLREVARGLAAAHARGLVHRDLKPDNVLVGPEMRPRILDFGLALSLGEAGRSGRGFEGTPLYASPEQVLGRALTTASDVFSLGSLMFKVLTGRAPFRGGGVGEVLEAIATTAPPFLRDVAVGVPEDLQALVLACMAWNPDDRPTAATLVLELGRFLAGEPVRLKPRLYDDLLRRRVSEYSTEAANWEAQGIISRDERDQLQLLHRRLLADEDHWIIDARRLTWAQTVLYTGTWIVVVAAALLVWLAHAEVGPPWRWLAPAGASVGLLAVGLLADRRRESLASASFLAAASLSMVPATLTVFRELGWFSVPVSGMEQLLGDVFTNQQILASCFAATLLSAAALARLRMTGFAWTTAVLGSGTYGAVLLNLGWLDWPTHRQALGCLPLVAMEFVGLGLERLGRVRWSFPFHLVAILALLGSLDVMAEDGPTLLLLGFPAGEYLTQDRLQALSFAFNGVVFLILMLVAERSSSLDLRRVSRLLEVASLLHVEGALFMNASANRDDPLARVDVALYLGASIVFLALGAWRGRWRMLVGALAGLALGSYLLVDLGLIPRVPFIFALGITGFAVAGFAFLYLVQAPRVSSRKSQAREKAQ
ncbi:MAG: protein kinase [Limisphaerales bacterium]